MSGVQACDIWKAFQGTLALRGAQLEVASGSIHALVGENGAGKSTLIKVITGVHRADRGTLTIGGQARGFGHPPDAIAAGVSAVYQERNLVPEFSVGENLFLHGAPARRGFLRYSQMHRDAERWLARVGLNIDSRTRAAELSVAQGQLVEIARALALQDTLAPTAQVLLLDEPTASITENESARLFDLLRELRDQGSSILFVSHKLDEVFALCDRVTVLRDGETIVNGADTAAVTQTDVITAMVGREVTFGERAARRTGSRGEPVLALEHVSTDQGHRDVSLSVEAGTVVGLYGLVGAGRTELVKAVIGLGKVDSGQVRLHGQPVRIRNPHDAIHRHRIGYMSEDRKGEGLILTHSVSHNAGITIWDRLKRAGGFITPRGELRRVHPVIEQIGVKLASLGQAVGELSGGNQQKVSVAKWLLSDTDVLVIDEPTVGVDIRTKEEMYALIERVAAEGKAVLVISSDLAEVVRLADRIVVMSARRIVAELENNRSYDEVSHQIMDAIVSAQPHPTRVAGLTVASSRRGDA